MPWFYDKAPLKNTLNIRRILKTTVKAKSYSLHFCDVILGDDSAHPKWPRKAIITCLILGCDISAEELKEYHVFHSILTGVCRNEWRWSLTWNWTTLNMTLLHEVAAFIFR